MRIKKLFRMAFAPKGPMTIHGGRRDVPHRFPRLRNFAHKLMRAVGLASVLCVAAGAQTLPVAVKIASVSVPVPIYAATGSSIPVYGAAVIDTNNSFNTTLLANATSTGTATNILGYQQIIVNIYGRPGSVAGDASNAKGSFFFEFSLDGTNWDVSVPTLIRDPSLVIPVPIIFVHKFFRVRYVNDGGTAAISALGLADAVGTPTALTTYRLTTYLLPLATKELTRTLDQGISGSDPASLTISALMGKYPLAGSVADVTISSDSSHVGIDVNDITNGTAGTGQYNAGSLTGTGSIALTGRCHVFRIVADSVDSQYNINGGATITLIKNTGEVEPCDLFTSPFTINWISGAIKVLIIGGQ